MSRSILVRAVRAAALLAAGLPMPEIVDLRHEGPAVVGAPMEIVVEARGVGLDGARLTFPDLQGGIGGAACGPSTIGTSRFALPYRPTWAGRHVVQVTVVAGSCALRPRTASRPLVVDVAESPQVPAPAVAPSCPGADLIPAGRALRPARHAVVCLLNVERLARGLGPVHLTRKLRRRASHRAHLMRRRGYRLRAVPGEQLSLATGVLSTPRQIVAAWLASDVHRRGLLDPAATRIGVGVVSGVGEPFGRVGATFAVELG